MSTDKTRADRYAATIIQHGLLTFDDCEAVAAELRRLSASETALLEALWACLSLLECHEHTPDREPMSTEPECMSNARTLIARTKEARNV